jgi:hypothetical protein
MFLVYVKEAHPTADMAQHRSLAVRTAAAVSCAAKMKLHIPVLLDTMDDAAQAAFDVRGAATAVIGLDGHVVFHVTGPLGVQPAEAARVLGSLLPPGPPPAPHLGHAQIVPRQAPALPSLGDGFSCRPVLPDRLFPGFLETDDRARFPADFVLRVILLDGRGGVGRVDLKGHRGIGGGVNGIPETGMVPAEDGAVAAVGGMVGHGGVTIFVAQKQPAEISFGKTHAPASKPLL